MTASPEERALIEAEVRLRRQLAVTLKDRLNYEEHVIAELEQRLE